MVNKLKNEALLISVLVCLVFVLALVYAQGNHSGNCSGNGTCGGSCNGCSCGCNKDNGTWQNKTQNNSSLNNTFVPWQQRTEDECPETCSCHGAVVSCKTETGKIMTITAGNSGKVITLVIDKVEVNTTLELEQEGNNETNQSKFHAKKSNGKKSWIKIMPDVASERALERLGLKVCNKRNNCTIVLKDVGNDKNATDNETLAYEMQVQRHVRILAMFQTRTQERAEVNAEDGTVKTHQPWWMFLATKQD
jgi:hypothetical protein